VHGAQDPAADDDHPSCVVHLRVLPLSAIRRPVASDLGNLSGRGPASVF
jgi:hypothetical protein